MTDLDRRVAQAKARIHRSVGQQARWAKADFLRKLRVLKGQADFLLGRSVEIEAKTVEVFDWRSPTGRGTRLLPVEGSAMEWHHKM